ncbi:MAG: PEP-CTERM sorting domain-containing protein [Planctomycetales bacterium]|nr:PEP-CTERM sorting domain-containing protein [Planctomycetales bacterium]
MLVTQPRLFTALRVLCACVAVSLLAADKVSAQITYDFTASDSGFTVTSDGNVEGPWEWTAGTGWTVDGSANLGSPSHSRLTSPELTVDATGDTPISFTHRYSIEGDLWDGAALMVSVNGGAFTQIPDSAFLLNGYTGFGLIGNHALSGGEGFNGDSPGYAAGEQIVSVAVGSYNSGDKIQVQFLGAWDEFAQGSLPNWHISRVDIGNVVVPEPNSLGLVTFGALGLLLRSRRRK